MQQSNQQPVDPAQRFSELYARCWPVGGKPGGLLADEAAEFARLAHALGVTITWQRFELGRTLDFVTHPTAAGEEEPQ